MKEVKIRLFDVGVLQHISQGQLAPASLVLSKDGIQDLLDPLRLILCDLPKCLECLSSDTGGDISTPAVDSCEQEVGPSLRFDPPPSG